MSMVRQFVNIKYEEIFMPPDVVDETAYKLVDKRHKACG